MGGKPAQQYPRRVPSAGPQPLNQVAIEAVKPRLRGVMHQYAFFVALAGGMTLVVLARDGLTRLAMSVYAASVAGLLGTSALYHRRTWTERARMWMRRLDHSMIFVLIAGTYTPFALLVLHGGIATAILIAVWAGALAGIGLNLVWVTAPKPVTAAVYITIGWVAVAAMPQLARAIGPVGVSLVLGGGVLYTAGAVIYALRRPNPVPGVFGYHEVFHALVVAAAIAHFTAVAIYALPARVG
ncbi:MAG: hemolysin III family protein [Actinobacteria bacterium]|nr:hemolysin III family protein [Actinomycetota bacterium]